MAFAARRASEGGAAATREAFPRWRVGLRRAAESSPRNDVNGRRIPPCLSSSNVVDRSGRSTRGDSPIPHTLGGWFHMRTSMTLGAAAVALLFMGSAQAADDFK